MTATVRYLPPDFSVAALRAAPPARTVSVERDGVLPEGFFATTNLPTYIKERDGRWVMPREPAIPPPSCDGSKSPTTRKAIIG